MTTRTLPAFRSARKRTPLHPRCWRIAGIPCSRKKLTIVAHYVMKSATEKMQAKGGAVEVLPKPKVPVRNKMKPRKAAE